MTGPTMIRALTDGLRRDGWTDADARGTHAETILTWSDERAARLMLLVFADAVTLREQTDDGVMLTRWEQITPDNLTRVRTYLRDSAGDLA